MKHAPNQPSQFAQAALCHAAEQHGLNIEEQRFDLVDRILDIERAKGDREQFEALKLCYGAWLGEWAVALAGGQWVGLCEPTPPRVKVNGVSYSPLDAVARRLVSEQAPTMQSLIEQLIDWSKFSEIDVQVTAGNRAAWDARNADARFVRTDALPKDRDEAMVAIDPWLRDEGPLDGRRLLCLAAGGGTHGPLFALVGADVTVVDYSDKQLEFDRQIAKRHALQLQTFETSIEDLSAFLDASFDVVVQPVSTCYVRDIHRVYAEIARVLRPDGLYIVQHKQPTSLQADLRWTDQGYALRRFVEEGHAVSPTTEPSPFREGEMTEFVHTWDALIGGLCRHGFVIEDLQEPPHGDAWAPIGSPEHRARFLPPYVKIKARRKLTEPLGASPG